MFSKKIQAAFFTAIIHFLAGLSVASVTELLVYFKQKPVLHYATTVTAAALMYGVSIFLIRKEWRIQFSARSTFLVLLILLSFAGTQLIYQIRPYTFYITGISLLTVSAIAASALSAGAATLKNSTWVLGVFLSGFVSGAFLPAPVQFYLLVICSLASGLFFLIKISGRTFDKVITAVAYLAILTIYRSLSVPIVRYDEQTQYEDKILFAAQTQFHKLVITQWNEEHWFYIDKLKNLSSADAFLYYEPMVHSVFSMSVENKNVLVLGSENGALLHEILKYDDVEKVDVVSYDTLLRNYAAELTYFYILNHEAYKDERIRIVRRNLTDFITSGSGRYDLIFIDLPDPRSIETNQFYTLEFYRLIRTLLNEEGFMITQAGSPYFAAEAFYTIGHTISRAGFCVLPLHNQILTLGEWGWFICSIGQNSEQMKKKLLGKKEIPVETVWFDREAAKLVSSFGKTYEDTLTVRINSVENPIAYKYYLKGSLDLE